MNTHIPYLSASELATKINAGELTSRQAVEGFFAQIKKHNPTYNAVVTLN